MPVELNQTLEIDDNVKFDDETDILKRKKYWECLLNLIEHSKNELLVISIHAPWWEGKTDFLKRWKNYLKENNKTVIYFDAFKNDFIEDPIIPLFWEILKELKWKKEKFYEKLINIFKWIMPFIWKILARIFLSKINYLSYIASEELEKMINQDIVTEVKDKLEKYLDKEKESNDFKKILENIIKEKWEIIFIIDELDRCKPDFALRLLERIKHFFNVKWLYFVLWINKNQIEKYIEKIYWNIDSTKYLQKFIDIETVLPKEVWNDWSNSDIKKFIKNKLEKYENLFSGWEEKKKWEKILTFFSNKYNLSLRDIEKIINYLVIFRKSIPNKDYLIWLTIILILLKLFHIEKYNNFKQWNLSKEEIKEILNLNNINNDTDNNYIWKINDELDFIFNDELDTKLLNKYIIINDYYGEMGNINNIKVRKQVLKEYFNFLDNFNI